jgi:hypothetical protein
MPAAKRRSPDKRLALNKRLVQIRREIAQLKRDRATVRRDEFVKLSSTLRQVQLNTDSLTKQTRDLATQFTRIAQIQAELDLIKRALARAKLLD